MANVTCLGCGCACDDIGVTVRDQRIVALEHACPLGERWFGDGVVPARAVVRGAAASIENAVTRAAELLRGGAPALVYLAPDLSTEAQREAIALADRLRARLDSVSSDTVAAGILAGQRRGRATATLGEIRNRADLLVFWATDPSTRYPRYLSRYALDPVGTHVPEGRAGRTVIAVDVGGNRGPADAEARVVLAPEEEVAALGIMRATVLGRKLGGLSRGLTAAAALAERMSRARYVVVVHDAEPAPGAADPEQANGLVGLAQALNGPTRCALSSLRGGGNRSGADVAMTWQTGYPFAVDFSPGHPRYRPEESAAMLGGRVAVGLIAGAVSAVPDAVMRALDRVPLVVIGPRATEAPRAVDVAIDTAVAGIHESGIAYRMDDIPLPLTGFLPGPPAAAGVLRAVARAAAPEKAP